MSQAFHLFVVIVTIVSILACLWLLFAYSRGTPGETTGHVWDDDLQEYNNPLPRWWLNLFIITAVFGLGYLIIFPGLGNATGTANWTSQQEMQAKLDRITATRQTAFARLREHSIEDMAHDASALSLGKSVYLGNCAGCHGADAQGARGYPNLADNDWLYGGDGDTIVASISNGRQGQMPPFNAVLSPEAVEALVALVAHWNDPQLPANVREAGMQQFAVTCAACHGAEGKGNPLLGAPNLTDDTWLWGGSPATVRETIMTGRGNQMPAHASLLSSDEIRVVAAYVRSLSLESTASAAR